MPRKEAIGSKSELRSRVSCHLPIGSASQEKAAIEVIRYIRGQRELGIGVTGYHSNDNYMGAWWSKDKKTWIPDQLYVVVVDYSISLANPEHALIDVVMKLKQAISDAYIAHHCKQEEIWITSEKLVRYI